MFLINSANLDNIALEDEYGVKKTYRDLENEADYLRLLIGAEKKCIVIICDKTIDVLCHLYYCLANHFVPYLISQSLSPDDVVNICNKFRAAYVICNMSFQDKLKKYLVAGKINKWMILRTGQPNIQIDNDIALLISTSGSTGFSKCVKFSYDNLLFYAQRYSELCSINSNHSSILILPCFFALGQCQIISSFYSGAKIYVSNHDIFDNDFWTYLNQIDVSHFFCTPYLFKQLCRLGILDLSLKELRCICLAGGFLESTSIEQFMKSKYSKTCQMISIYAQTEFMLISCLSGCLLYKEIQSAGIPLCQIQINADNEIMASGRAASLGYVASFKDLSANRQDDEFIHTGDIGFFRNGILYISGRKAQFSKLAGIRVSHVEVEQIVYNCTRLECACIGDDTRIIIYIAGTCDLSEMKRMISQKFNEISPFIIIKSISRIPRLSNGKIDYQRLINMESI